MEGVLMKKLFSSMAVVIILLLSTVMMAGCLGNKDDKFKVIIENCNHGIITVDKSQAKAGEIIEVSAIAEKGYELVAITCDGVVLRSAEITMPKHDITLTALFEQSGNIGSDGESEELISLNLGTYICQIEYNSASDYSYGYFKPSYEFNALRFKEGNKVDAYCYISSNEVPGNMYSVENILYTRQGNTLTAEAFGFNVTLRIIDENNVALLLDGEDVLIFARKNDVAIVDGRYSGSILIGGDASQELILNFLNNALQVEFNLINQEGKETIVSGDASFMIKGDRLYVTVSQRNFAAVISVEDRGGLIITELVEFNGDGIDYILQEPSSIWLNKN